MLHTVLQLSVTIKVKTPRWKITYLLYLFSDKMFCVFNFHHVTPLTKKFIGNFSPSMVKYGKLLSDTSVCIYLDVMLFKVQRSNRCSCKCTSINSIIVVLHVSRMDGRLIITPHRWWLKNVKLCIVPPYLLKTNGVRR